MFPNVTASFERCHWLHLNVFMPQGSKHLKCLRGFIIWRCLLLQGTSVSPPLFCGGVHTHFWSHAPRCILLWKLEEIAIWVLKHKIKMPLYCACLWGIGLKPQFRQLCVSLVIQQRLRGEGGCYHCLPSSHVKTVWNYPKSCKSKSNGYLFSLQIIYLPTGTFCCPFSLTVPLKAVHLDNIVPP